MALTWDQPAEIAWALADAYPRTDPLDLNFVELLEMIVGLEGFDDEADATSEQKLEAIVVAWHEQS